MKVFFHVPSESTIYAGRTIHAGYKHAFEDMGHEFVTLTAQSDQATLFREERPDILITSLTHYSLKFLDVEAVTKQKKEGMKVFVNIPFWHSPMSRLRINETPSLSENREHRELIRSGTFGDVYYNNCEQDDERMAGFSEATGYPYETILLAADKVMHFKEEEERFHADLSYIGTYLPEKRKFMKEALFPLRKKYDLRLYGQDWTVYDRGMGLIQKAGQFFNVPFLSHVQKPKLSLEDERRIYASSTISLNIHEEYQKRFGGDCNERVFKIPACGGFEITDDVACIRRYLKEDVEIVIAKNKEDWFQKIEYYIEHPEESQSIIEAGRNRVLAKHTYHNRVLQMMHLYESLSSK